LKEVSLYIPCFNAEKTIAACLEAVLKLKYPVTEVVVIDDGSADSTAGIAASYPVRLLRHGTNRGLAAARNTAIKNTQAEFVAALDADCVPNKDWLSCLMRRINVAKADGVGGKLIEDRVSSVFDSWRSIHMRQSWGARGKKPEFLFGSNTVFRRKVVLDVGLYNESFRTNYEDVDISRRLIASGARLVYDPKAVVHHLKQDDMPSLLNAYWNWGFQYSQEKRFYSDSDNFALKMQDNIGLANRYLEEDLEAGRKELLYLDFLLAIHHSLKDLEYFTFRGTGAGGVQASPKLSSWLAMIDLVFSYHYARKRNRIASLLYPKERIFQNLFALIFIIGRHIDGKFKDAGFKRLLYKHLLVSSFKVDDDVLVQKLIALLERHPQWDDLLIKTHPHLNDRFLEVSQKMDQWFGWGKLNSPKIVKLIKKSQEDVESHLYMKKELLNEERK
jgi:glycosyltransferase involved in cell wall biosynthesis